MYWILQLCFNVMRRRTEDFLDQRIIIGGAIEYIVPMVDLVFYNLNVFHYQSLCIVPLKVEDFFFITGVLLLEQMPGKS